VAKTDRIQLSYDVTFTAPFHHGTGLRLGLIDRTVVRDHDGYLYVPGSTIKGCVREQCERLSRLYEELDQDMLARIASPHDTQQALWAMDQPVTMVTRIFGSHHHPGRLFFDDARQAKDEHQDEDEERSYKSLQTSLYTQARLDRPTRTAVPGALYTSEFGTKDFTLHGTINGWLTCIAIETLEHKPTYSLLLLLAGLHMIDRLGGNKSTGKGQCCIEIQELKINGGEPYKKEKWQFWLDHLEALSYYSSAIVSEEEEA